MNLETELEVALDAARKAGTIQTGLRGKLAGVTRKDDNSPVTEVDRGCEKLIRDLLLKSFASDGFMGEETGSFEGISGRRWIVDPLDGTRPYVRGIPTSSVLIALEEGEELLAGVIHLPFMNETYWAVKQGGAFLNGSPVKVSDTANLKTAMGSSLGIIEKYGSEPAANLIELLRNCDYAYGFMDAYTYGCVAAGRLDLSVNLLDKPWDCAAAACIVSEAGGRYSDVCGRKSVHNGSIVLTNGILHNEVLEFMKVCRDAAGFVNTPKGGLK
jgi:histidinol phosphatase-like enzyme (inositol monophosphatase family)